MLFFGTRIVISKYCCRVLSSLQFVKLNFLGDCICGVFVIIFASVSVIKFDLYALITNQENVLIINSFGTILMISAELLIFKAINDGVIGPVVAIVGTNAIIASLLQWIINGVALAPLQLVGIAVGFGGVIMISNGSQTEKESDK